MKSNRLRAWLRACALSFLCALLSSCTHTLTVTGRIPTPLIEPLPVSIGFIRPVEFSTHIHRDKLPRGGGDWTIELGALQNAFFETLFDERVGPVCRADKVEQWFDAQGLRSDAVPLHTRTRLNAWTEWANVAGSALPQGPAQIFEHFYFSLQAAVAGLGVAIGPWHLVRDDIDSGLLVAPLGFVEDGSRYCLFSPAAPEPGSLHGELLAWLREMGR